MVKRWAVFAAESYEAIGGMKDYKASFDTKEEAEALAKKLESDYSKDWIDVEDMDSYA